MINQETEICIACLKRKAVCNHHYILRRKLTALEVEDSKFIIPLCSVCHDIFHSRKNGGYIFYKKHNLIDLLTYKCDNDERWQLTLKTLQNNAQIFNNNNGDSYEYGNKSRK